MAIAQRIAPLLLNDAANSISHVIKATQRNRATTNQDGDNDAEEDGQNHHNPLHLDEIRAAWLARVKRPDNHHDEIDDWNALDQH